MSPRCEYMYFEPSGGSNAPAAPLKIAGALPVNCGY
jgi:hypothetical protein